MTSIPATCCCSSGTTPPSSCAPPSPRSSPPFSGCFGRRARWQDVPVHPAPPLLPAPTFHPAWSGCLRRWVLPVGGITSGAVTSLIQLFYSNCNTAIITVSYSKNIPFVWWEAGTHQRPLAVLHPAVHSEQGVVLRLDAQEKRKDALKR